MDTRDQAPYEDFSTVYARALADAQQRVDDATHALQRKGAEATADDWRTLFATYAEAFGRLHREYGRQAEAAPVVTQGALVAGYWKQIEARKEAAKTGLNALDTALGGGLQSAKLMILLGAPGSGKTTLANQIGEEVANDGRPVLYVTSEDPPAMLLAKTAARLGGVDYSVMLRGQESARAEINRALSVVYERQSAERLAYLHDTGGLSLHVIMEQARAHFERFPAAQQGGPGLLVIDYLQRLARSQRRAGGRAEELRTAVSELTDQLRAVAIELDCTVLALASQNRGGYGANNGNALASAKESGDIEYGCDVMLALAETEKKAGIGHRICSLYLAKNRLGPSGGAPLELDWWGARQQFAGVQP